MRFPIPLLLFVVIALCFCRTTAQACSCVGSCTFLGTVDTMFLSHKNAGVDPSERIVIVKAVILDTIPNSGGGTRLKLLTQFFGWPVKDTFIHLAYLSNCEVSLRSFYERSQDTLFLMLARVQHTNSPYGDTVNYQMSMCGKRFAVVKNDSVVENCPYRTFTAAAIADSLTKTVRALKVNPFLSRFPDVKVYPNPSQNYITIEGMTAGSSVAIYSIIGSRVITSAVTSHKQVLSLSSLLAGNYILLLTNSDGATGTVRITKE